MGTAADFSREQRALETGAGFVAGIDEAGRGPLAGPVVAAAVILDPKRIPDGLADSKALSAARREALFDEILKTATVCAAGTSASVIDKINIRQATLLAMRRAIAGLARPADYILVDGRDLPGSPCPGEAVVDGDALCLSIAAASIVAKVTRDRMMDRLASAHPDYGFERNRGYGTAQHLDALRRIGPCPIHRMTFRPLSQSDLFTS
ncbi:ribonuclease HII [Microbaculum sp. FT89]|uniref:ribonuclease HII n=1 Tax=Microbaculum sp. FT89 TaxID=3447298 RepID=UPI003F52F36C